MWIKQKRKKAKAGTSKQRDEVFCMRTETCVVENAGDNKKEKESINNSNLSIEIDEMR